MGLDRVEKRRFSSRVVDFPQFGYIIAGFKKKVEKQYNPLTCGEKSDKTTPKWRVFSIRICWTRQTVITSLKLQWAEPKQQ